MSVLPTPGPWTVGSSIPSGMYVGCAGSNYHNQPSVSVWTAAPEDKAQCLADARLIAAAPALCESLRTLLYDIDCLPDSIKYFLNAEHVKAGEDAIALAEGNQ